jgi:hypothetical protein
MVLCHIPEEFNFTKGWFQKLIICCHGVMCAIVVTGNAAQFCHLETEKSVTEIY